MNIFNEKQAEVYRYDREHSPIITICEGAVRSSKTIVVIFLWLKHILSFYGQNKKFIMTGYTIPSLKKKVLDEMSEWFGIDTHLSSYNEFAFAGNRVCCFGSDKSDSYKAMRGMTAFGWYGNEVTLSHDNTIDQAIKRCSGKGFRIFLDTNPDHPRHPVKVNFIDRSGEMIGGRVRIKAHHFTLDDNTFLAPEYIENLKKSTPAGMFYDRDILGLWVSAEGLIYKDFNYSKHLIEELPCGSDYSAFVSDYFAGVDWGYDHRGVIGSYGVDHDGTIYRLCEIAEREKTIKWWIDEAKRVNAISPGMPFYCDSARPDYIREFRDAGINAIEADKGVIEGITFCAELFKRNKFFVIKKRNPVWCDEIGNYRWKPNTSQEQPIKDNDDAMDEMRYACYTHFKGRFRFVRIGGDGAITPQKEPEQKVSQFGELFREMLWKQKLHSRR